MKGEIMKRWGIWLVSFYFFAWALSSTVRIIINPGDAGGFFGIYRGLYFELPFLSYNNQIDFDAWWKVGALLLIGYFLLRFHPNARLAALILLWLSAIWNGLFFLLTLITEIPFFRFSADMSITFHFLDVTRQIKGLGVLLFTGFNLFITSLIIYILMRKEVKMEFQTRKTVEVTPTTE